MRSCSGRGAPSARAAFHAWGDVARLLAAAGVDLPPTEAQLRRAVSTAYYALFHTLVRAGARRFMGPGNEGKAGYALLYRGFNHNRMKAVCKALEVPRLGPNLQRQLGREAVSPDLREFAGAFVTLQEARHRAHYDPRAALTHADAIELVEFAHAAMQALGYNSATEQSDVLALMLANPRD